MKDDWRYFDGAGDELRGLQTMDKKVFADKFGDVPVRKSDGWSVFVARNRAGELRPVVRSIRFKRNPSLHKCDARCMNAKGHDCECSCGGKNHGARAA